MAPSDDDPSSARSRLSLISRHLDHRPRFPLNTPFSIEREASDSDDLSYTPPQRDSPRSLLDRSKEDHGEKMAGQAEHPTLLIPGPIELDDDVLKSMSHFAYGRLHLLDHPMPRH